MVVVRKRNTLLLKEAFSLSQSSEFPLSCPYMSERGVCPRGIFYPWVRWDRGLANFRNCFPASSASVTNISDFDNLARTRKNWSDKIMLFLDQTPMWNWSTSEVSTTPSFCILRSPHQKFKKPGKADVVENLEIWVSENGGKSQNLFFGKLSEWSML